MSILIVSVQVPLPLACPLQVRLPSEGQVGQSGSLQNRQSCSLQNRQSCSLQIRKSGSLQNRQSYPLQNWQSFPLQNWQSCPLQNRKSCPLQNRKSCPLQIRLEVPLQICRLQVAQQIQVGSRGLDKYSCIQHICVDNFIKKKKRLWKAAEDYEIRVINVQRSL